MLVLAATAVWGAPSAIADDASYTTDRHGRFVWRVPVATEKAAAVAPTPRGEEKVTYDKGDRGTYERHTRTVHKVSKVKGSSASGSSMSEARGVVYDKGDRGVYVRHTRTVTRAR